MRAGIIVAGMLLLPGCVSAGDLRAKPPILTMESQKTPAELVACLSTIFSRAPGAVNRTLPIAGGYTLTQAIAVAGVPSVTGAVDIEDAGDRRTLAVRSVGKPPKDLEKVRALYTPCL